MKTETRPQDSHRIDMLDAILRRLLYVEIEYTGVQFAANMDGRLTEFAPTLRELLDELIEARNDDDAQPPAGGAR